MQNWGRKAIYKGSEHLFSNFDDKKSNGEKQVWKTFFRSLRNETNLTLLTKSGKLE